MRSWRKRLLRAAGVVLPLALGACHTFVVPPAGGEDGAPPAVCEPGLYKSPTVHALACDLDHLERHIDWHGSVTAKVPDVWGQPRLTLYREQFEEQLTKDIDGFKESYQGSVARADQAFALSSTALAAAVSSGTAVQTVPAGTVPAGTIGTGTPTTSTTQQVINVPPVTGPAPTAGSSVFATFTPPPIVTPTSQAGAALNLSLEPTEYLTQKQRYLNLLAQIRRTNEGDDTADAPGYALNLMRVPVSVLPGKRTQTGFGAEITMTLTPVLGDDLLPTTFRKLVINDVTNQIGLPIAQMFNESMRLPMPSDQKPLNLLLADRNKLIVETVTLLSDYLDQPDVAAARALVGRLSPTEYKAVRDALEPEDQAKLDAVKNQQEIPGVYGRPLRAVVDGLQLKQEVVVNGRQLIQEDMRKPAVKSPAPPAPRLAATLGSHFGSLSPAFAPGTSQHWALPVSQLVDTYGSTYSFEIAYAARQTLKPLFDEYGYAHLPDVRGYLKEELNAAYDLLNNPQNQGLWDFCSPQLVQLVRTQNLEQLDRLRRSFRQAVAALAQSRPDNTYNRTPIQLSQTTAYAWAILIDAALLTERMCKNMQAAAARPGACIPAAADWLPLYRPTPDVCQAFNAFVAKRWPIHVFAIDPDVQEQNLTDQLYSRREFQFALSLAFSSGKINFNQLSQYARRVEAQYQTITLNRTQVGFGDGPDTFGWRFYPRFQTPDTPGTLTVIFRDLLLGGPNRKELLRERQLEPGPRECVALVIMPSFVPEVTLDSTANFFALTNPKHKVFDHAQAMKLGKTVQAIATSGCEVKDAALYRSGDVERLMMRARQLADRLPMQTVSFPVPTEDTTGGFELFGTSTTNLAPALYGWYGAPGVDAKKPTTLFLVGDHFSALRTQVIAGNKQVGKVTMLSRQVVRVDFGPDAVPLVLDRPYVSLHVGTPYGVSRELLVPVQNSDPVVPPGYYLSAESQTLEISVATADGNAPFTIQSVTPDALGIRGVFPTGVTPKQIGLTLGFASPATTLPLQDATGKAIQVAANENGLYTFDKLNTGTNLDTQLQAMINQLVKGGAKDTLGLLQAMPQAATVTVTPATADASQTATPTAVFGTLRVKLKVVLTPPPPKVTPLPAPTPLINPNVPPPPEPTIPKPPAPAPQPAPTPNPTPKDGGTGGKPASSDAFVAPPAFVPPPPLIPLTLPAPVGPGPVVPASGDSGPVWKRAN